jgi:hypothetical protein
MKNQRPTALIFDMDGTIVDTLDDITDSVNFALRKHGLPEYNRQEICSFIGKGSNHLIDCAIQDKKELFDSVFQVYYNYYLDHFCVKTHPYDGIIDALTYAKEQGILLYIYTNKPHNIALEVMHRCFPKGLFDLLVGIPLNGIVKPDPNAFFEAVKEKRLDFNTVCYFGDSVTDIVTAHNLGCKGIYSVLWGFQSKEKLSSCQYQPTAFLSHPNEIKAVIDGDL